MQERVGLALDFLPRNGGHLARADVLQAPSHFFLPCSIRIRVNRGIQTRNQIASQFGALVIWQRNSQGVLLRRGSLKPLYRSLFPERLNTFSPSLVLGSHPQAQTRTSAHPRRQRNMLSLFSASSCHRARGSRVCNVRRAIRPSCARLGQSLATIAACCKAAA